MILFLFGGHTQVQAKKGLSLNDAYDEIADFITENSIDYPISFEQYMTHYNEYGYQFSSIEEYNIVLIEKLDYYNSLDTVYENKSLNESNMIMSSSSSSSGDGAAEWYFNIVNVNDETDIYYAPGVTPNYSTCNLLDYAKVGDIIYKPDGVGHVSMVVGLEEWSDGSTYVQVIESMPDVERFPTDHYDIGVVRSVYDCDRFTSESAKLLRVSNATTSDIDTAVSFMEGELGKRYLLLAAPFASCNSEQWYCSELVSCAYAEAGYDIYDHDGFAITPEDVFDDDDTYEVNISIPLGSLYTSNEVYVHINTKVRVTDSGWQDPITVSWSDLGIDLSQLKEEGYTSIKFYTDVYMHEVHAGYQYVGIFKYSYSTSPLRYEKREYGGGGSATTSWGWQQFNEAQLVDINSVSTSSFTLKFDASGNLGDDWEYYHVKVWVELIK